MNEKIKRLLIVIFLGWLGIHKLQDNKYAMFFIYLFTFGLFGIGWLIDIILAIVDVVKEQKRINRNARPVVMPQQPAPQQAYVPYHQRMGASQPNAPVPQAAPASTAKPSSKLIFIDRDNLVNEYDTNIYTPDSLKPLPQIAFGEVLDLVQEPENEYDNKAVALYYKGTKIGYLYKGDTQNIVNSYLKKENCQVVAYYQKPTNDKTRIHIEFYNNGKAKSALDFDIDKI